MTTDGETTRKQAFKDLSEDALGFGGADIRTARDLLIRPRLVLQAWMIEGPTGGGVYAKPLKLYLALNAILMLIVFLRGGMGGALDQIPADVIASLVAQSGKSRDAFMADADGWMSFLTVPLMAPLYALAVLPFVRWWDAETLGWRRGFRASFAYLNAWTVPMLPLFWFIYGTGPVAMMGSVALFVLGVVTFVRMGRGRWYRGVAAGIGKGLVLQIAINLMMMLGSALMMVIGVLAGLLV
ncbi:hypothetical protein SH203_00650 [Brevundimonas sp. SH203]|uniref:hypothetical protein n=1 Tax=Brevundimonas sp. SH203 TaxID=345167 RepID=UPI0009CDAD55|nr:hypothetical protein [Brevundimonas sp. SH203]GAW40253.1 hypothetical protein SH203_00650 [Brevundimonas sp. SH203]